MRSKLLLISFLLLAACDPLGRLTGTSTKHEEPVQPQVVRERYEGDLRHANYVRVPLDGAKSVEVFLKHKGSWIRLEQLDEMDRGEDPYYLISKDLDSKSIVIFQNEDYRDLYSIEVTR